MSRILQKLRERVQILKPVDVENDEGGFDRGYTVLTTVWANVTPIVMISSGKKQPIYGKGRPVYIREVQAEIGGATHQFTIRTSSVSTLGTGFSSGFSSGFDSIANIHPLSCEYFLFMQRGSTTKGRLFQIRSIVDNDERREFLNIFAEEIEEQGTGITL